MGTMSLKPSQGLLLPLLLLAAPAFGQPPSSLADRWPQHTRAPMPDRASLMSTEDGIWSRVPAPTERAGHTAIFDPVRKRMIVMGGSDRWSTSSEEVYALSLTGSLAWTVLPPFPGLSLSGHTAIYDPLRDRMVVFGMCRVWTLSLGETPTWAELTPAGESPDCRGYHTAIHDPARDRMIVFGGFLDNHTDVNDVWALSLGESPAWSRIEPVGPVPSPRSDHTAIYDPLRNRMVVYGGGGRFDVWVLSLGGIPEWTEIQVAGTPPDGWAPDWGPAAIYDPVRDRMVIYSDSVWTFSLAGTPTWKGLARSRAGPYESSAIYDPAGDRMIVFGGLDCCSMSGQLVALSLSEPHGWVTLDPLGAPPPTSREHTAVHDATHDQIVVYPEAGHADVWMLSLESQPQWRHVVPTGRPEGLIGGHASIHDPLRGRMVTHSGQTVWTLSLGPAPAWSALTTAGTPPTPRAEHTAIYDPVRDRMLIFGGDFTKNDVWALTLGETPTWSRITAIGPAPVARARHVAIYDPVRDRMVIFGGESRSEDLDDVWALSLDEPPMWTRLTPSGPPPHVEDNQGHAALYDPVRDRMVVFVANNSAAWALSLGSRPPVWRPLSPATARGRWPISRLGHTATYDPRRDRAVLFGGDHDMDHLNDTWTLTWGTPLVAAPAPDPVQSIELLGAQPHPFRSGGRIRFAIPRAAPVTLRVLDVTGRLVATLVDGPLTAGRHEVGWNADVPAGVYFVQLRSGQEQQHRRLVVIRD